MELVKNLFIEDQEDCRKIFRGGFKKLPTKKQRRQLEINDQRRRKLVLRLLKLNKLRTASDYYYAAMILHHGTKLFHFRLAHQLATKSMRLGYKPAKWLYAATLDRYLKRRRKPQKYCTQYVFSKKEQEWVLYRCDPISTDFHRKKSCA